MAMSSNSINIRTVGVLDKSKWVYVERVEFVYNRSDKTLSFKSIYLAIFRLYF